MNPSNFFGELKRRNVYKWRSPTRLSDGFWRRSAILVDQRSLCPLRLSSPCVDMQ